MMLEETVRDGLLSELAPEASFREVLLWAVGHGCLAPSELNSQPWLYRAVLAAGERGTLDLLLDQCRALPRIDPNGREAVLACGASLFNVRLALRGALMGVHVSLCPDANQPELLARVSIHGKATERREDRMLRLAIPHRSTHRGPFLPGGVPDDLAQRLVAEAAYEGAFVTVLDEVGRRELASLNAEAQRDLWSDGAFRRELAAWTRGNGTVREDGVPGFAHGLSNWQAWLEPARIRAAHPVAAGELTGTSDPADGPLTMILGSANDAPAALMRAGCGLQRLLLAARTMGLSAGYMNAALHVSSLRPAVARLSGLDYPQLVLRIGSASVDLPTPRRSANEVLRFY